MTFRELIQSGTLTPNGLIDTYDSDKGSHLFWLWYQMHGGLAVPDDLFWIMWKVADMFNGEYSDDAFRSIVDSVGDMLHGGDSCTLDWKTYIRNAEKLVISQDGINDTDKVAMLLRWDRNPNALIHQAIQVRENKEQIEREIAQIFRQVVDKDEWIKMTTKTIGTPEKV